MKFSLMAMVLAGLCWGAGGNINGQNGRPGPDTMPGTFQQWIAKHPYDATARPGPVHRYRRGGLGTLGDSGDVALYVDPSDTGPLKQELTQFTSDMGNEGYTVNERVVSSAC